MSEVLSKHFRRHEFACKCGCGFDTVDAELLIVLENIYEAFNQLILHDREIDGIRILINSGCRCFKHNIDEKGSAKSFHLVGQAADIVIQYRLAIDRSDNTPNYVDFEADIVADYFEKKYPNMYGIGRYNKRTHIDVRSGKSKRWDHR